jgi:hypothetical protein
MPEEERKKKDDEKAAQAQQETEESLTQAKRKGYKIFMHGDNFKQTDEMVAEFTWNDSVTRRGPVIYKNPKLLASSIPDFGADMPPEEEHLVSIRVSLNGQQFNIQAADAPVQFRYKSTDPNLTEEELRKKDEEDVARTKKQAGKKK